MFSEAIDGENITDFSAGVFVILVVFEVTVDVFDVLSNGHEVVGELR